MLVAYQSILSGGYSILLIVATIPFFCAAKSGICKSKSSNKLKLPESQKTQDNM